MSELEQVQTAVTARSDRGYLSNLQGPAPAQGQTPEEQLRRRTKNMARLLRLRALDDVPSPIYPPESGRLLSRVLPVVCFCS